MRSVLAHERLALGCIATLLRNPLHRIVVALRAAVDLFTRVALSFCVGIAQLQLAFSLASLTLFDALAAFVALRRDLCHASLSGLFVLRAVRIVTALLPRQFTRQLLFGLLARFFTGLLALLELLLGLRHRLLFGLRLGLLLSQFLARAAVIVVVVAILRACQGGRGAAQGNHRN